MQADKKKKIQDVLLSLPNNSSSLRRSQDYSTSPGLPQSAKKVADKQRKSIKHQTFSQDLASRDDDNDKNNISSNGNLFQDQQSVASQSPNQIKQPNSHHYNHKHHSHHHHHQHPSSDHLITTTEQEEQKVDTQQLSDEHGFEKKGKQQQHKQSATIIQYPTQDSKSIIIRDGKGEISGGRPVELIEIRDGKLNLNADLLEEVLLKYEGNISFVAVHGLPATGKSTFLNQLLQSQKNSNLNSKKFYERNSKEAIGTEGVIMWSQPIYHPLSNMHTFLMDVQGIDKNDRINMKLQLLSMLLCDVLFFTSSTGIKQTIYSQLEYLVELSNMFPHIMVDHTADQNNQFLPAFVILHKTENERFRDRNLDNSFEYDFSLENILFQVTAEKLSSIDNITTNSTLLKIKKLLKQSFRSTYCFPRKEENGQDGQDEDEEDEETLLNLPGQFNTFSNYTDTTKKNFTQGSRLINNFLGKNSNNTHNNVNHNDPKKKGNSTTKDLSIFSRARQQTELHTPLSSGKHPHPQQGIQQFQSYSGGTGMNKLFKISKNNKNYQQDGKGMDEIAQFQRIIGLSSHTKKFRGIPVNASTFCKFAMLLVEEINNDTLLDVTIPVNKSIAADLKRSMEDCLNSHKTGIESLVSYEQFQSMGNIMTSLSSLRTSIQSQFHQRAGRFKFHQRFSEFYQDSYSQLNCEINKREKQVFRLFQNISFGQNEAKFRFLTDLAGLKFLASKTNSLPSSLVNTKSLNELENSFVEILQQLAKDFLVVESGLDGVLKVNVFLKLGMNHLSSLLKQFYDIYALRYASRQLESLRQNSNQPLLLKFQSHLDILNKKSKLLEEMMKTIENETTNLKELQNVLKERVTRQYAQQKTWRENAMQLQRIQEKEELIKSLDKRKTRYLKRATNTKRSMFQREQSMVSTGSQHQQQQQTEPQKQEDQLQQLKIDIHP